MHMLNYRGDNACDLTRNGDGTNVTSSVTCKFCLNTEVYKTKEKARTHPTKFRASTVIAGRFVQMVYDADSLADAWEFARDNLYPKGSSKLLRVAPVPVSEVLPA